jgi:hypothetical protein
MNPHGEISKGIKKILKDDGDYIVNAVKRQELTKTLSVPDSSITIRDAIDSIKDEVAQMAKLIETEISDISSNMKTKRNLQQATDFYKNNLNDIGNKIENIVQKEKLNKRISQFYNNDYDFKKNILYYLKIFYLIMVSIIIITIIYKKKHKEKKMYGFLFLLFVIPYFLIKNIYRIVLNNLGHLKIDVLYVIFLIIIGIISYGLFFISKYILTKKQGNLPDILKETAETLKSNSSILK